MTDGGVAAGFDLYRNSHKQQVFDCEELRHAEPDPFYSLPPLIKQRRMWELLSGRSVEDIDHLKSGLRDTCFY